MKKMGRQECEQSRNKMKIKRVSLATMNMTDEIRTKSSIFLLYIFLFDPHIKIHVLEALLDKKLVDTRQDRPLAVLSLLEDMRTR